MNHSLIRFYLVLALIVIAGQLSAQQNPVTTLQKHRNLPCAGDSIVKQQVIYIEPGPSGTNIEWDFRSVRPFNEHYCLFYQATMPDTSQIDGIEHGTVYRYRVQGDSLLHTGYENSTTLLNYTSPELKLRFPFRYGEKVTSDFRGEGEYCHRTAIYVEGKTTIVADATGTLYAPLGLTFENALRVKSLREYAQTGVDSVTMQLESYAWYVHGNRYPVFETVKASTRKTGQQETEHKMASFFYPPAEQATLLADTSNWEKDYPSEETFTVDQLFTNCKLMPNPVQSQLHIEYDLVQDATISFSLYDNRGVAKIIIAPTAKQAGHYTETLQMGSFITGIYPIYVTVDGLVKVMKVIKR